MAATNRSNRRRLLATAVAGALFGSTATYAAAPVTVTSGDDSGPGTLRAALAGGANIISISGNVSAITIDSTLRYEGTAPLRLMGVGQTIRATDDFTLLESATGGNMSLMNVNFRGIGGFDLDNPGNGKGVFIQVPSDRTGIVRLEMNGVTISGVANHGAHVSDCTLGDDCGSGSGGGGDGSPASIHVIANQVTVDDAGNGRFDADGIRVDERAVGDIVFESFGSVFRNVGADGIELDEGNTGDVYIDVRNVVIEDNGGYCLPAPLDLEEPCVEDDDGELVLDLDDAFDVDEAGDGSFTGSVIGAVITGNLDEGLDFDEEGPGGVTLDLRRITAMMNGDEGVKVSAANAGDVFVDMRGLDIQMNGNDGIEIEAEDGAAQVHAIFRGGIARDNESEGIAMAQENVTELGTLKIRGNSDVDAVDLENVEEL